MPLGVKNTDEFLRTIMRLADADVKDEVLDERGLLIDSMADLSSRYLFGRTAAVYGDPDMVAGISRFLCELGMVPRYVCTGTDHPAFRDAMKTVASESMEHVNLMPDSDLRALERELMEEPVDILIGNSDGRLLQGTLTYPL